MMGAKIVMRIGGLDFLSDQQRYLAGTLLGDKILYTFGKLWSGKRWLGVTLTTRSYDDAVQIHDVRFSFRIVRT